MRNSCFLLLALASCTVEAEFASLSIVSPAPGSTHAKDQLGADGDLVANVGVEVDVGGDVARVALRAGDVEIGDFADGKLAMQLGGSGVVTLTAVAFADDGAELISAAVDISISDAMAADCRAWLDLYRLDYTVGPEKQGVADPVTVKVPINGVSYRYTSNTAARETLFADCSLIKSLAKAAPILRRHDIKEVADIGIYNYRCIDQTKTPPNCTMSQHAYAKAIDIAGFEDSSGARYSVLTDWVIDTQETCAAPTEPGKDEFLHKVICELKAADVWNIVLTPNYNDAHRNHFHVDLTKDSDFIKRAHEPGEPLLDE